MRPLLAIILTVAVIGGLNLYMRHRGRQWVASPLTVENFAPGIYALDLTFTFRAQRDAFALKDDPIVRVKFRGADVLLANKPVDAGEILHVEPIENIVTGHDEASGVNEFYYEILTGDTDTAIARCVRLRVFRDGQIMADQSAWSDPGEPVRGTLRLAVVDDDAGHDHQE